MAQSTVFKKLSFRLSTRPSGGRIDCIIEPLGPLGDTDEDTLDRNVPALGQVGIRFMQQAFARRYVSGGGKRVIRRSSDPQSKKGAVTACLRGACSR